MIRPQFSAPIVTPSLSPSPSVPISTPRSEVSPPTVPMIPPFGMPLPGEPLPMITPQPSPDPMIPPSEDGTPPTESDGGGI